MEPLEPLPPYQVVLASSGEEVSTGEVYQRFDSLGEGRGPVAGRWTKPWRRSWKA